MDLITTNGPKGQDIMDMNGTKAEVETPVENEKENSEVKEIHNSNIVNSSFTLIKKSKSENIELDNDNSKPVNGNNLELNYKEDQWSPNNPSGKKYYDCDFLYLLRDSPIAQKKPDNPNVQILLADLSQRLTRPLSSSTSAAARLLDGENGNFKQNFIPAYARGPPRSGTPSRRSQHGKQSSKGGNQGPSGSTRQDDRKGGGSNNKSNIIQINLSRDVKLNECENAWKPARQKKDQVVSDDEKVRVEELYKKFRSILNKITPQNFKKLICQVRELKIETEEALEGVINLVFEKAIDEPNFAETYALMCKELEQIKVKKMSSTVQGAETYVSFRYLIIKRCQNEFEKEKDDERQSTAKLKEIEECADADQKKNLQLLLDEEERKSRMRSVGNVRFIGELFKQSYINKNIMIECILCLLNKIEEETMECLCKLLTTIGKSLEVTHKLNLQSYMNDMNKIAKDKTNKLNRRIRFMIEDVIWLRNNNWVPRQTSATPKKLDEFQTEPENDRNKGSYSKYPSSMSSSQRDDRMYSGRTGGSRSVTEESGWSPVPSSRRTRQSPYVFDSEKLRNMAPDRITDISLGPPVNSMWSRGSASGKKDTAVPVTPKPTMPPRANKTPVATKTFNSYTLLDESYLSGETPSDASKKPPLAEKIVEKPAPKGEAAKPFSFDAFITEFRQCSGDPYSELLDLITYGAANKEPDISRMLIHWAINLNVGKVIQVIGKLTGTLVHNQNMTCDKFLDQFRGALEDSLPLLSSNDGVWDLLSKFVWSHCKHNELTFSQLHSACTTTIIKIDKGYEFLMALFLEKVEDCNEVHLIKRLWEASNNMTLTDWMKLDKAKEFLTEFGFICSEADFLKFEGAEEINKQPDPDELCAKLLEIMENRASGVTANTVKQWIETNVGEGIKEVWFIRALTEAVYSYILCLSKYPTPRWDDSDRLNHYYELLIDYINEPKLKLECLFSIQNLMNKLEHPNGIALKIFEKLWETDIISAESFMAWKNDPNMQIGKGVMLKSLKSFFTALESSDDDLSDETSPIEEEAPSTVE